jgi:hypothetical protein
VPGGVTPAVVTPVTETNRVTGPCQSDSNCGSYLSRDIRIDYSDGTSSYTNECCPYVAPPYFPYFPFFPPFFPPDFTPAVVTPVVVTPVVVTPGCTVDCTPCAGDQQLCTRADCSTYVNNC